MDGELPQGANVTEDAVTTAPGAGGSDEVFHELLTAADRSEMMWWAVGCGLLTFCVFLLATVIYVRKVMTSPEAIKKKKKSERKRKTAQEDRRTAETAAAGAVPQHHFIRLLRKKRMRGELGMEFRALGRKVEEGSTLVASSPENAAKNAHPDALPYDHCLVHLTSPPADTAYINASYIDGYDTKNVYIAAQGPCRGAIDDFWQLVWQQKVTVIVMATNVFEHARQQCEKYWHNEHGRYGGVDVWLDQQDILAEFTVRTFRLSVEGCDEERVVKHFQFASWSDHDCPNPSSVMECRRRVRVWLKQHPGPMLVHCGAGAGRTGTFIAIDDAIEQASTRRAVDVFNYVLYLRSCRQHMVRDQSQYEFIYDTVAMYLQCGDTVIGLADLPAAVRELAKRGGPAATGGAGGNSFEQQFKTLQTLVAPLSVGECAGGHRAENRRKSRDIMLQPPERARPYLITHDTNDSTDYINAVYVDGYRQINAFIVTQWPLRSTMNDVWRLVYDYNVPTIVLLNNMAFSRNYPCFWPNEIGAKRSHGPLSIELIEEQEDDSIRTRLFKIKKQSKYDHLQASLVAATEMMNSHPGTEEPLEQTLVSLQAMAGNSGDENYKVVKMFQLKCWPNSHKVPASAHGLLELLTRVEDWQINQCHGRIPTLVISKNGVSRCGCYCAISHAWEKLKVEGEVDIFRAVKNVKTNRPQLVENLKEYRIIYDTFQEEASTKLKTLFPTCEFNLESETLLAKGKDAKKDSRLKYQKNKPKGSRDRSSGSRERSQTDDHDRSRSGRPKPRHTSTGHDDELIESGMSAVHVSPIREDRKHSRRDKADRLDTSGDGTSKSRHRGRGDSRRADRSNDTPKSRSQRPTSERGSRSSDSRYKDNNVGVRDRDGRGSSRRDRNGNDMSRRSRSRDVEMEIVIEKGSENSASKDVDTRM